MKIFYFCLVKIEETDVFNFPKISFDTTKNSSKKKSQFFKKLQKSSNFSISFRLTVGIISNFYI